MVPFTKGNRLRIAIYLGLSLLFAAALVWVFAGEIARLYDGLIDDRRCRYGGG